MPNNDVQAELAPRLAAYGLDDSACKKLQRLWPILVDPVRRLIR